MRQKRRVRRHDDDDRSLFRRLLKRAAAGRRAAARTAGARRQRIVIGDAPRQIRNLIADWHAGNAHVAARSVIALHQHANRVAALFRREFRGGADAALKP
jgi:hypothetical protein